MMTLSRRRFLHACSLSAVALGALRLGRVSIGAVPASGFPKVDLHVHLSREITLEKLAEMSKETGFKFGITEHPGPRYSRMTDGKSLNAYLDDLNRCDVFKGIQPVDPGWRRQFSKEALAGLDYVLMDALEIPDGSGGYSIIWDDNFKVDDEKAFMDVYVKFYLRVLNEEQPDILASPTFLPLCLRNRYDQLWTDERMATVIDAAVKNQVALEINSMYRIPSKRFIHEARRRGAKFSFGTNGRTRKTVGALDYSFAMAKECNLAPRDIFLPVA